MGRLIDAMAGALALGTFGWKATFAYLRFKKRYRGRRKPSDRR